MEIKSFGHLVEHVAIAFSFRFELRDPSRAFVRRFVSALLDCLLIFLLFFSLSLRTYRLSIHRNQPLVGRSIQHGDRISLVAVFRAIALAVVEFGHRGPVAIVRLNRPLDDRSDSLLGW